MTTTTLGKIELETHHGDRIWWFVENSHDGSIGFHLQSIDRMATLSGNWNRALKARTSNEHKYTIRPAKESDRHHGKAYPDMVVWLDW